MISAGFQSGITPKIERAAVQKGMRTAKQFDLTCHVGQRSVDFRVSGRFHTVY